MTTNNTLVLVPDCWEDVVQYFGSNPQYIFRGQANAQWGLSTKIERICYQNNFPATFIANRESVILREFQRRAHHYITDPPEQNNKLEWYALIQHYGGATRLLDFTYSFYIAAYFAMESAESDAAVWALDTEYLYQHTNNTIGQNEAFYDLQSRSREVVENNLSHSHVERTVMAAEPERLNERISIQQGIFAIPGDISLTFEDNLAATYEINKREINNLKSSLGEHVANEEDIFDASVIKIILPVDIHNSALLDLQSMNITAATLFPGLQGFAKSLNSYLRDVE